MATSTGTTSTGAIQLSGLASNIDWSSLVSQLMQAERAPETQMRAQQTTFNQKNTALQSIGTALTNLGNSANALLTPNFFQTRLASSSNTAVANATATAGTALGTYTFNISQLASDAVQQGATAAGSPLSATNDVSSLVLANAGFATGVTGGTFTVNGQTITISTSDTLQSVFNQINTATGGAVAATYDHTADTIKLSGASPIVLGSATDTSNFLQVAKLYNNGTGTVISTSALGGVNLTNTLNNSNLSTAISDGGSGNGAFSVNGVTINFNASTDTMDDVLARINNSAAGVTATYDTINNRFALTNKTTGDVGISLQDVTGNFLAATGLSGGTLQHGNNLQYTINNGGTLVSQSNIITAASSGVTGLNVTATGKGITTISIGSDTNTISSAITSFVTQYNSLQTLMQTQTAVTTGSSGSVTAGILAQDLDVNGMQTQMRSLVEALPPGLGGVVQTLNDLGIVSNGRDNTLSVSNPTALSNALANNLSAVQTLFTDPTSGIATTVNNYINTLQGTNGLLATKENDLSKESTGIDNTIAALERKITDDQNRLTNEFVNMETVESQINTQKQYLTSYFSSSSSGG